jgi:hypothetical protein
VSTEAEKFIAGLPDGNGFGQVPKHARKTLLAIASLMRHRPGQPDHAVCYATQSTIGERCGTTERTVRCHIALLEKAGILIRAKRARSGMRRGSQTDLLRIRGYGDQPETAARSTGNGFRQ